MLSILLFLVMEIGNPFHQEKYAERIVDNTVYTSSEGKKRFWLRQFVCQEKSWSGWRCTGYLVVNEDTVWERVRLRDGRWQLSFFTVSGKLRHVTTHKWTEAETTKDIEIVDREKGPRKVLFGSIWGNIKED